MVMCLLRNIPLHIGSSDTVSDDVVRVVSKIMKEEEGEHVKAKGGHK